MSCLKDYPPDFVEPLKLSIEMLNNCSIRLFDDGGPSVKKYFSYFFMMVCFVLHYASLTKFVVEVFIDHKEMTDLAFTVPIYIIVTQAIFKAMVLISHKKEIRYVINQLGTTWRTDLSEVQMKKRQAQLRKLEICQKTIYYIGVFGSFIYSLTPLFEILLRRFFLKQECELLLPYPCSYPFNPFQNLMLYAGLYVFQIYSMFRFIYGYLGTEFLMVALCSHLVTEFSLLNEDLLQVKPNLENGNNYSNEHYENSELTIGDFCVKHQKLTVLCGRMDAIFNKLNCMIFVFATVVICLFAFGAKVTHGMFMAVNYVAVVGVLGPLLVLCYYSEMLRMDSTGIADSAYTNIWYNGEIKHQKCIAFIIMRSQKPCCMTILKYTPITLNTFSTVLSTTWSYFSLISSLYEEV